MIELSSGKVSVTELAYLMLTSVVFVGKCAVFKFYLGMKENPIKNYAVNVSCSIKCHNVIFINSA